MKYLARVVLVVLATASIMLGQWGAAFGQTQAGGAAGLSFDHTTTGYFLDSAHKLVGCESCHTAGVFRGTPRACATCHAGPGARAPGKPATHIPTTAACDACHRPGATNWTEKPTGFTRGGTGHPINPVLGVTATNCQVCHNGAFVGANAQTKPAVHIQTAAACGTCHGTTSWTPATNPHAGVVPGTCATCHNGANAPGKKADHIPTSAVCDTCHTNFISFIPAKMDHTGLNGQCSTCHSGRFSSQNAQSKPTTHVATAEQCDTCHASTSSWSTAVNYLHPSSVTIGGGGCAAANCHGSGVALGKPSNHVPTSASCDTCHTNFTSFKPATMAQAHPLTTGQCASCHNGSYVAVNALGRSGRHIPTSVQCDSCHTSGFVAWSPARMSHAGLDGQCSSCHSGGFLPQNAQTKTSTHIGTSAQCDTCHSSTTTWATGSFNHSNASPAVAGRCSSCHNGTSALGKPTNHIPTAAQCDTCHKTFAGFTTVAMSHAGTAGKCTTCHAGDYIFANALAKSAVHIPTSAQCDTCHTGGFTAWSPAVMNHTGLTGQCSNCHGGANVTQNAQAKPATHVSTTKQCDVCHGSTTSWATVKYNHEATAAGTCDTCHGKTSLGKPLTHIPTTAQCDNCHNNFATFKPAVMKHGLAGEPSCATCHGGAYVAQNAQAKPATHIQTADPCSKCHTTTAWKPATYDHSGVTLGSCATCHNGVTAMGKSTTHIPTSASCDTCHGSTYTAFKPATMNHAAVVGDACATCHSGAYLTQNAQTKPTTHQATSAPCSDCHKSTTSWATATQDHSKLSPPVSIGDHTCNSCHNGTKDKGLAKPSTHIPTTGYCDTCHKNFGSFAPASMDHSGTIGQCSTCHGGGYTALNALAKPSTHVTTTAQCDTCHGSTTDWKTVAYAHDASAYGKCSTCHDGSKALGVSPGHIPTGSQQCSDCHKNFVTFKPAQMNHVLTVGLCSTCHNATYAGKNAQPMTAAHIKVTEQCDTCHQNGYITWSPATMDHTAKSVMAQTCATCHSGAYLSQNAQQKPSTHQSTSAPCSDCHKTTTTWATATQDHSKLSPPVSIGDHTCSASCHNGTKDKGLAKPTTHIPTTAYCDTCHTNFTAFAPAAMNHSGTAGACANCHGGGYTALNAQAKPSTHITTTQSCDTCHATTAWKPVTYSHSGVAAGSCATCHNGKNALGKSASHIPTAAACDTCHKNFAAFTPAQMNHTGLAGQCSTCHGGNYLSVNAQAKSSTHLGTTAQCDTCHSSTTSWATATFVHANPPGVCSTCHNGSKALGKPTNHIPTSAACDTCHKNQLSFKPAQMDHTGLAGQCSNCHSGGYVSVNALAKPTSHIPVTEQCDTCHTKGFTTWSPAVMLHSARMLGQCTTCHSGAYLSQNAQVKSSNHTPTTAQCDTCHKSTNSWSTNLSYTHASTTTIGGGGCSTCHGVSALGKSTNHVPTSGQCDSCHKNFTAFAPASMNHTGTSNACATCHGGAYTTLNAQAKPSTHIATTQSCDVCHGTSAWKPTTFAHQGVTAGSCANCHNGTNALGKNLTHIPTALSCDTCHKTTDVAFAPANRMTHTSAMTGQCSTCHNGSYVGAKAVGKPTTHVSTTAQCDTCHATTTWTANYTHPASAPGTCSNCHNGTVKNALSKASAANGHIPTTGQCDTCHKTYTGFAPATMSHTGTASSCSSCHNGSYLKQNALAKPASGHVVTSAQCDTCHTSTVDWKLAVFSHPANAVNNCTSCHNGTVSGAVAKPATHIKTTAQCDTCHRMTAWSPTSFAHTSTQMGNQACSACHNGTNATGKPAIHIPTSEVCSVCHRTGVSWLPLVTPYPHSTVASGTCTNCHLASYPQMDYKPLANHVPTTASCDACHIKTDWATVLSFTHVGVTTCATCHSGTYIGVVGKTSNHIPTTLAGLPGNECSNCHKDTKSFGNVPKMGHGSIQTGCKSCHNSPAVYNTGTAELIKLGSHEGSKASDDCSQSGCHKPMGKKGTPYSKWD